MYYGSQYTVTYSNVLIISYFGNLSKATKDQTTAINIWNMAKDFCDKDKVPFWIIHYNVSNTTIKIGLKIGCYGLHIISYQFCRLNFY